MSVDTEKAFHKEMHDLLAHHKSPSLLLAISGGVDSVVMGHLCASFRYKDQPLHCGVAYLHHGLRREADEEAIFVEQLAQSWNFNYHSKKVKLSPSGGLQATARRLRYEWLESLRTTHHYTHIATAHHLDDSLESILIHLLRGTGLAALRGCAPSRGALIRPLHNQSKAKILSLAQQKGWKWKEDTSNHQTHYLRNSLRHQVLAPLQQLRPSFHAPFARSLLRLREIHAVYEAALSQFKATHLSSHHDHLRLKLPTKLHTESGRGLLYGTLKEFDLHYKGFEQLYCALLSSTPTGKWVESPSHRIHIDRHSLLIEPKEEFSSFLPTQIEKGTHQLLLGSMLLRFRYLRPSELPESLRSTTSTQAYLDADLLRYPLLVRTVRRGDRFHPLGMLHRKKISDLMIDQKIPQKDKKKLLLLTSEEKIAWVIGLQIDNRFRVQPQSRHILHITLCTPPCSTYSEKDTQMETGNSSSLFNIFPSSLA